MAARRALGLMCQIPTDPATVAMTISYSRTPKHDPVALPRSSRLVNPASMYSPKLYQLAMLAMINPSSCSRVGYFLNRFKIAGYDTAATCHGIKQAPTRHKGASKITMNMTTFKRRA